MSGGKSCPMEPHIGRGLRQWYERPLGQLLAADEQAELDRILPDLFGYHLLQVGFAAHSLFSASRILHRAVMAGEPAAGTPLAALAGDPEALPIATYSLDAVILHHALEFCADPRQVLREAERVLVGEGHLVILGFNSRSLWGMCRWWRRASIPWSGRFLSTARVKDWLDVLGFEIVSCRPLFFRPPYERAGVLRRLQFMERLGRRWWPFLGSVYVLVARKKVMTLTPIKPRWRPRRSRVGLADPAARSCERRGSR
jgi:SAM-dependent methyltransferase